MVSPEELRDFFAEIFSDLDANPRAIKVSLTLESDSKCMLDFVEGEPVFCVGEEIIKAKFRNRWLAEHPVPLELKKGLKMKFIPTSGNRVKVRI